MRDVEHVDLHLLDVTRGESLIPLKLECRFDRSLRVDLGVIALDGSPLGSARVTDPGRIEARTDEGQPSRLIVRTSQCPVVGPLRQVATERLVLEPLVAAARRGPTTLVHSARDTEHNAAVVLRDYLVKHKDKP